MEYDPGAIGKNNFAAGRRLGGHGKLNKSAIINCRCSLILEFSIPVMEYVIGNILLPAPAPLCEIALLPTYNARKHSLLYLFVFYHMFLSKAIVLGLPSQ